jgi:hypothetical protein
MQERRATRRSPYQTAFSMLVAQLKVPVERKYSGKMMWGEASK